ncbi:MAG TPA: transcriptional repressor LexA, partial [Clostridiales bacterium]|nr:transcriptional repressor LexA [Clostridiales bacterium]
LLGTVAAGSPLLAYEDIEEYLPYSGRSARGKKLFALRVRGDSMVNAGIFDGDIVIAEQTPDARDREIVVALLEDGATVKRFFREGGGFRLQPENDSMEPIYCKEVLILGRVIALIRNY